MACLTVSSGSAAHTFSGIVEGRRPRKRRIEASRTEDHGLSLLVVLTTGNADGLADGSKLPPNNPNASACDDLAVPDARDTLADGTKPRNQQNIQNIQNYKFYNVYNVMLYIMYIKHILNNIYYYTIQYNR